MFKSWPLILEHLVDTDLLDVGPVRGLRHLALRAPRAAWPRSRRSLFPNADHNI